MKTVSTRIAVVFASLLGVMAALPLSARAETALPGMAGADTTASAVEQRGAPYMVMLISNKGMMTEREVSMATATELMKHSKPLAGMVLVHDGKAYLVDDMKTKDGKSLMTMLMTPYSQGF